MPLRSILRLAFAAALIAAAPLFGNIHAAPAAAEVRLPGLGANIRVAMDSWGIPHIYGESPEDVCRALGYLHARDRIWQMELFRRQAAGRMAEIIGKDGLESDRMVRRLGIRRTSEEVLAKGLLGPELENALKAYCEGVNAWLAEAGTEGLPSVFKMLGATPEPWVPADGVAFAKYMGWDQGGTDTDLWLGMMAEKLGPDAIEELWPLDRPYEVPTIPVHPPEGGDPWAEKKTAAGRPSADLKALASRPSGIRGEDYLPLIGRIEALSPNRGGSFGSNNWVISGDKSATGKPILSNDPHLGLAFPSVWYVAHLSAPGLNVMGVTFPGQPFVTIGHNDRIAWGITNMQADAVDYFIETLDPAGKPGQYLHKGEWKPLAERRETIKVKGAEPVELVVQSTVHGPVEKAGERWIATAWTGLGLTLESRALFAINRARGLKDFLAALRDLDVPALNMVYADVEGNIAMAPHGDLPIRARGLGRVPVDGASGEFDWTGMIPHDQLPISVNPARGWLASANGRPAPMGYPHHLGWMWDPSYRTRRITDLLSRPGKISPEDMKAFVFDSHDKCAEVFIPVLIEAYDRAPYGNETVKKSIDLLRSWDFVCAPDKAAPSISAAWFGTFRSMVWEDEWESRGIQQPGGSWGFAGDNRREPALEILERMTRVQPDSIWFDDRRTPERERRDDIFRLSFEKAVAGLAAARGPEPSAWPWGPVNKLRLESLTPMTSSKKAAAAECFGGQFTLNPGGTGGGVGSGASWRQVIDLGDWNASGGVYPGGQSASPRSPHFEDLVETWASGRLTPLWFHARPEDFPAGAVEAEIRFSAK